MSLSERGWVFLIPWMAPEGEAQACLWATERNIRCLTFSWWGDEAAVSAGTGKLIQSIRQTGRWNDRGGDADENKVGDSLLTEVLRRGGELQLAGWRRQGTNKQGEIMCLAWGNHRVWKEKPKEKGNEAVSSCIKILPGMVKEGTFPSVRGETAP